VTPSARKFCTVANFITLGRLLLLIPLFYFLREGREGNGNFWAMVIMAAALISDMLDGLAARALHQVSDWGKVLDPVTDKLWIGCLALFLTLPWREHPLQWWFTALIVLRDVSIIVGGYFTYRRTGILMMANWLGKVTMVLELVTLISFTVNWVPPAAPGFRPESLMWLSTLFILLSGVVYAFKLRATLRGAARSVRTT
jgi:cardiolipin synthase (CMP-forming)